MAAPQLPPATGSGQFRNPWGNPSIIPTVGEKDTKSKQQKPGETLIEGYTRGVRDIVTGHLFSGLVYRDLIVYGVAVLLVVFGMMALSMAPQLILAGMGQSYQGQARDMGVRAVGAGRGKGGK